MKVALLTAGGIAPCLSAAVGRLVHNYLHKYPDIEIIGYLNGYKGLLLGKSISFPKSLQDKCEDFYQFGGSPIGNSRVKLTNIEDCILKGYIESGEIPYFKIYDHSEGVYYDAVASQNISWQNGSINVISQLEVNVDCQGILGGTSIEDECGVCDGDSSSCGDCAGIPNGDNLIDNCGTCDADSSNDCILDCAGVWGGDAMYKEYWYDEDGDGLGYGESEYYCSGLVADGWVLNNADANDNVYCLSNDVDTCDVCDGGNADDLGCGCFEPGPSGCDNVCGSIAELDNCGVCDEDPSNDCTQDCNGEWGGNAELDNCGNCDDDLSNDCPLDCAGIWGGDSWESDCGCVTVDNSGDDCDDCVGVPYGEAYEDDCGVCSGGTSGHIADSDIDCAGVCFGDSEVMTYWNDDDGDALGNGISQDFCSGLVPD